jgi:Co/Zn/Cd efflux system component
VVVKDGHRQEDLLHRICELLARRFQIEHATIQIEPIDFDEPGGVCFS